VCDVVVHRKVYYRHYSGIGRGTATVVASTGFNCFGFLVTGGIIGNEEADDLVGVGCKSNFCGQEACLLV
jgi:hypothetical protein